MRLTWTSLLKETRGLREASERWESERVTSGIPDSLLLRGHHPGTHTQQIGLNKSAVQKQHLFVSGRLEQSARRLIKLGRHVK